MLELVKNVFATLSLQEKKQFAKLSGLIISVGIFDVIGIASIFPFIAILSNRDVLHTNQYFSYVYQKFQFLSETDFLVFLGCVVLLLLLLGISLKVISLWFANTYGQNLRYNLSIRFLSGYLARPYSYFLQNHSANLGKVILSEVNQVVTNAVMPITQILSSAVSILFMTTLMFVVSPPITMFAFLALGLPYLLTSLFFKHFLDQLGIQRRTANRGRFHVITETFNGIRDVKAMRLERACVDNFALNARAFSSISVKKTLISALPSFVFQGLTFTILIGLLIYLLASDVVSFEDKLATIVLFAIAINRLQGSAQQIYQSFTSIRFAKAAVEEIVKDYDTLVEITDKRQSTTKQILAPIHQNICLSEVNFAYEGTNLRALDDITIKIWAGTSVGFVGTTGSGKSTIINIILGLLNPSSGSVLLDGVALTEANSESWSSKIGHVSQTVFLKDDTIAANIAFRCSKNEINLDKVKKVAEIACISSYVERETEHGYSTAVGERGIKLSGGQVQRIGIARALYNEPEVLIFDEATSSLDKITERKVIQNIRNFCRNATILMVAHRVSTLKHCDKIFVVEKGKIKNSGSYDELTVDDPYFSALLKDE